MFKQMAWLLMAVMILAAAAAQAQAPRKVAVAKAAPRVSKAPDQRIELQQKPIAPDSPDRLLAPDQLPTNVVKILRTSNKAQTNSYVPVVFDFKNTNPFNAIRFLRRPVQLEEGAIYTFVNPTGTGGKALFVVPDYMIPSLKDLVETVDRPGITSASGDQYTYVQLKHRRVDTSDPDFLAAAASYSSNLNSGSGATIIIDPEENAIFLKDSQSGTDSVIAAVTNYLDVPTAMLDLTVKIYEIDANNDSQIGLDYMAWKNGPGSSLFSLGAFSEHGGFGEAERVVYNPIGTGARGLPHNNFTADGYNASFRYDVPSAFFDFLAVKGKARVLNEMKIAALNTRPTTVTAGNQILYYAVNAANVSGVRDSGDLSLAPNQNRTVVGTVNKLNKDDGSLTAVEAGLSLTVTPIIGEKAVKMAINLAWSDFSFTDDKGVPQINKRKLSSTLTARLGEEIILGGLDREQTVKSTKKVPILGSIPFIGYAFGGETSENRKTEMVVVITPSAVSRFNLAAKSEAEKDYFVKPGEQSVIDQANGTKPVAEVSADFGFDQAGLDKDFGKTAKEKK